MVESTNNNNSYQQQLDVFVENNTVRNCPQRSQQWYDLRLKSFGGSEIASLMGNNKYKSQKCFFKEKKEKIMQGMGNGRTEQLNDRNIMDWGSFFEPIHRDVLQLEFDTSIQECSLTLGTGILKGCHQSPDGLSVVETQKFKEKAHIGFGWADESVFEKPVLKVLWEQKCPSFRNPNNILVPPQYIGQIKLGLSLFDVCDIACFSDSVIRISSSYSLSTKSYNKKIVTGFGMKNREQDPQPLYVGFIDLSEAAPTIGLKEGDNSSDLTAEQFNLIMEFQKHNGNEYKHHIYPYEQLKQLRQQLPKQGSYICWKLVKMTSIAVEKSKFFPHILSTFISIGQQELNDKDKIKQIGNIAKVLKQLNFPLDQVNKQDEWYLLNKNLLIDLLQKCMEEDWQSLYVLLYLLLNSQDEDLVLKAQSYIQQLREKHVNDPDQLHNLEVVIKQLE